MTAEDQLVPLIYRRARHIVSENQRVLQAVQAMITGDAAALGKLMNASHLSMRDDFEISRAEMDQMVEIAQNLPGCYGARMTGGGFGGCAVALIKQDYVNTFQQTVTSKYREETGLNPQVYISYPTDGTSYSSLGN
jgi:galactokinase